MTDLRPFLLSFAILLICLGNVFCVRANNEFARWVVALKYSVILKARTNGFLSCVHLASSRAVT